MKTSCIIVEDEPLAMERTVGYIRKLPGLSLSATFDNAMDAFAYLQTNKVDLIFLDINLGELSGLQLLESLRISSDVIITTAYPEFALKGYDLDVTDYLLKPYSFERFLQAVGKIRQPEERKETQQEKDYFFVKTENRLEKIFFRDVLYIEGMRDYRKIHTTAKKIMTLQTFSELEAILPPAIICRVHKSYMVSVGKIESIEKDIIHIAQTGIPVSDTYRPFFYSLIGR